MSSPNSTVAAGNVRFSNSLPLGIIAGPCQMESRDHALEMAAALKEISEKVGVGLVSRPPSTRPTGPAFPASAASASKTQCRSLRKSVSATACRC